MKKARSIIRILQVSSLLIGLGVAVACGKTPAKEAKAPLSSTPTTPPKFDGVYAAEAKGRDGADYGWDYLRFFADGRVLSLSSPAPMESAVMLLYAPSKRPAAGTYETKDGTLKFVMKSDLGTVEYEGVASADNHLLVRWHSQVNGASAEETFSFVPVEEKGDADASAAPDASTTAPDLMLLPSGSGWFCFRGHEAGSSRCERTAKACEGTRKKASGGDKLGKCARQGKAFCSTVTEKASAQGMALCYPTEEDCTAANALLQTAPNAADFSISGCDQE